MNPFQIFEEWLSEEKEFNNLKLPAACCLSTTGLDGYPNSRFVSLKEVLEDAFIITGSLNSRKGLEIKENPKVALSFWWAATERQVRIQGDVSIISTQHANDYFKHRNRDSQIVSVVFKQGKKIESIYHLQKHFKQAKEKLQDQEIACPEKWSGISIKPVRIEFMQFKKSRLHERICYTQVDNIWQKSILQP